MNRLGLTRPIRKPNARRAIIRIEREICDLINNGPPALQYAASTRAAYMSLRDMIVSLRRLYDMSDDYLRISNDPAPKKAHEVLDDIDTGRIAE